METCKKSTPVECVLLQSKVFNSSQTGIENHGFQTFVKKKCFHRNFNASGQHMKSQFHTCKVNKVTFCPSNPSGTSLERENESVRLTPHNPPQDSHSLYSFAKKKRNATKLQKKKYQDVLRGQLVQYFTRKKMLKQRKDTTKKENSASFCVLSLWCFSFICATFFL